MVTDKREGVRATTLQGVMEKIMEKNHAPKSNIPQSHSSANPEIRRKIIAFQQRLELLSLLRKRHELLEDSLKSSLHDLIEEEEKTIQSLRVELAEFQGAGEQWFMLIGDFGGGSFKLMLSDLAAEETNSFQGGYVIGEMMAKDTYFNLKTVFGCYAVSALISHKFLIFNDISHRITARN
jgi:hypothetical protein